MNNYSFVFIFIVSLVFYLTIVDARHHGGDGFHSRFGEQGLTSDLKGEISPKDSSFGFFRLCFQRRLARHRWLPDFLKNISSEAMTEFCNVVKNENLTKAEIEQQLDGWGQKQGEDIHNDFNEYLQEEKQKLYAIQQKIQQLIVNVTQFIEEIEAIQNDEQLTRKEEKEKLSDLVNASDRTVLVLAKKIRAEADSEFDERRRRSSSMPPPFRHQRPSFDSRMRGGAPQFRSGNSGPFGGDGSSGHNGPYGQEGTYERNGNPGQAGFLGINEPVGEFGNPGQNDLFENDGNLEEGKNPEQNGPFGRERRQYSGRNGRFGHDKSLKQDKSAEQNMTIVNFE